jgi:hypothetical protein
MTHQLKTWRFLLRSWRLLLPALAIGTPVPAATAQEATAAAARLPQRLTDSDFWALVTRISEPGGYFRIADNFTSNEREIGQLYTMLRERGTTGGVYMGVGPEQNLTYIAAIRPEMAFIVDIRRQAVMQHLMFKAIFDLAADRADFISILFSKPRPAGLTANSSITEVWEAFWPVQSDSAAWKRNYDNILGNLTRKRGFTFAREESDQLKWVFDNFFWYGPEIRTRGGGGGGGGNGTTFADLTGYSHDSSGQPRSFLSSEENFQFVKSLHERNLIVPVSGDFAGPKAIRTIGEWLKERNATVSAFYVSNVEQYLFQDGKSAAFYENVATLPVNEHSVFIRPYSLRRYGFAQPLCPINPFLQAAAGGRAPNNSEALACPR